jgi:UTP-glucose-1-phosphate uridylyltransferase
MVRKARKTKKVTKAIIAAAGLGSRMYPFTKVESKLMIPIINKPVVEILLEELAASGIKEVIIVSNHTDNLKELFKKNKNLNKLLKKLRKKSLIEKLHHVESICDVDIIQQKKPFGWMHEVWHAKDKLKDEPFLVCFSDVMYISKIPAAKQAIDAFKKEDKNIRSQGRFVFKQDIFDFLKKEDFELGKYTVDLEVFDKMRANNDLYSLNIEGQFCDIGDPLSYLQAETVMGLNDKKFKKEYRKFLKELIK